MRWTVLLSTVAAGAVGGVAVAAADGSAATGTQARVHRVTIKDFVFKPKTIRIAKGQKVTWDNKDLANHSVTFKRRGPRDIDNLKELHSGTVRFTKRGRYAYVCQFHPSMHGVVVVR